MKCLQVFLSACVLGVVVGKIATPPKTDNTNTLDPKDQRVVGGFPAPDRMAPYQVSLRDAGQRHFCGASIVGRRWIVTAGHCVADSSPAFVVVGSTRLDQGGTMYRIKSVIPHPAFNKGNMQNDIALIQTVSPMALTPKVQPLGLPTEDTVPGDVLLLTGWGTTSYPGVTPRDLQYVSLRVIPTAVCRQLLGSVNYVFDTSICTLNGEGQGACHGDSGGPVVDDGKLVGVVSWGYPCAKGLPDVFTRVWSYRDWISKTVNTFNQ